MYLCDRELKERLHESDKAKKLTIIPAVYNDFLEDDQVGVCSIDLKLSSKIWLEKKTCFRTSKIIDLRDTFCDHQVHAQYWEEKDLPINGYTLKPGECILARIDEYIEIPLDCLGKIESRSGMNRLLLIITLGDFVNPGYKGHYPLQIINMSRHKIRIYPKMSVCQLLLSKLSVMPDKHFSEAANVYYNDDGGPSLWWEDRQRKLFMKESADIEKEFLDQIVRLCEEKGVQEYSSAILSRYKLFYKEAKRNNDRLEDSVQRFLKQEKDANDQFKLRIKQLKGAKIIIPILGSMWPLFEGISFFMKGNALNAKNILIVAAVIIVVFIILNMILISIIHKLEQKKHLV